MLQVVQVNRLFPKELLSPVTHIYLGTCGKLHTTVNQDQ